jgi:hypothetical protein
MLHRMAGPFLAAVIALCACAPGQAAGILHRDSRASADLVAFTRNHNVFLTRSSGGALRTVTTRGTAYTGIVYPWYSWSPDGRYLLLIRMRTTTSTGDVLLLNQAGTVLRTLATVPAPTDFWPSWAIDADQIAFVAAQRTDQAYGGFRNMVYRSDITGHKTFLFTYLSHEGCGGGTGDPAEALYWGETGFGGDRPSMSWSMARSLAAYTASCAGGVNLTDLGTRRTRHFGSWKEPALSARGVLAVVNQHFSPAHPSAETIFLVSPSSGSVVRRVAEGELPLWSRSGTSLYFVQRRPGAVLHATDAFKNPRDLRIFTSAIEQAHADGTHVTRVFSADAFGFGALNLTSDGRSLIFSRVDNDWALWRHRHGNVLPATQGPYAPTVRILRLDLGRGTSTLATNAGNPAVQP